MSCEWEPRTRRSQNSVLKAKRHQRYVQRTDCWRTGSRAVRARCSTPKGIKGMSSCAGALEWRVQTVLNAKRHQRYVQEMKVADCLEVERVLNAKRHQRYVQETKN